MLLTDIFSCLKKDILHREESFSKFALLQLMGTLIEVTN
jgi:hypothetical protein